MGRVSDFIDNQQNMTLAYRVEELLALRDAVSESAISLNKLEGEDALRGMYTPSIHLPIVNW